MKLLKRSGVQSDWSWEDTLRAVARDPQYRAIKDPKDRRSAFEKYCHDMITQDKERAQERMSKLRADFETMLKRHPEIKHYTRWKTARPMIEGETIFRSTNNETERRQLFEEYIVQLKRAHIDQQANARKTAMDGLVELLPTLNLEPYTRWSDARGIISTTQPFQNEEKYQSLSNFDILTAFQNHMKALERRFNDSKQEEKNTKFRKERKARDGFLSLLGELREQGKINAATKWHRFLPLIENDERYKAMAGQQGSTPQELFWDVIEEEERALRGPRNDVLDALDVSAAPHTPLLCFDTNTVPRTNDLMSAPAPPLMSSMLPSRRTAVWLTLIATHLLSFSKRYATRGSRFDTYVNEPQLKEKKSRRPEEDKRPERPSRRAVDDFRAYLKRIEPPISINDPWEKVKPRCVDNPAFQALPEDAALGAFEKHIRRLRDKEEDAERDRRRRRDHASSERDLYRDRERDRSRGERSHRGSGRGGRRSRSRSPEVDAYEADRRKAIAERERNHRKSTMAESFLSERERRASPPPRRDRERDRERDRDLGRDYDRPPRPRRDDDGYYDRDRRDREDERERLFRRRVGSYDELPYGDERPSGSRRRREDDEDDRRDSRDSKVRRLTSHQHKSRLDAN
jgi:pre-mRNA-processing factor 40